MSGQTIFPAPDALVSTTRCFFLQRHSCFRALDDERETHKDHWPKVKSFGESHLEVRSALPDFLDLKKPSAGSTIFAICLNCRLSRSRTSFLVASIAE